MDITRTQAHAQVEFWGRACRMAIKVAIPVWVNGTASGTVKISSRDKRVMKQAEYSAYANARAAARAALILFPELRAS